MSVSITRRNALAGGAAGLLVAPWVASAQANTLLSQLGHKPPVLDLHRVLRPNPV